jgi:hypothetical protein
MAPAPAQLPTYHHQCQVQRSYSTHDCTGAPLDLLETYLTFTRNFTPLPQTRAGKFVGFPAGCGDCAAPKLLHAAAELRWRPVSMVEFYYGAPPRTATKAKPAGRIDLAASLQASSGSSGGDSGGSHSEDGALSSSDIASGGAGGGSSGAALGEGPGWEGHEPLSVFDEGGGSAAPFGMEPAPQSTTRMHGRVYGACDKCIAILGTMLHGMD